MNRDFTPQIVIAKDPLSGDRIYLTDADTWTRQHHEAELIEDEAHAQMRLLDGRRAKNVIDAVLADASREMVDPRPRP